jgi:cytoskeleton protein RodZ
MIPQSASELIAQQLIRARQARAVSVEQAAAALRIRLRYVEAMEKGDFSIFPSPAQARGFLRSYVKYLNLDAEPFLAALDGDTALLEGQSFAGEDSITQEGPSTGNEAGAEAATPRSQLPLTADGRSSTDGRSTTAFAAIGQKLRRQREILGLSLDDIEAQTRLRAFYLNALEAGDLDSLPSPVQGRGMLKNYASFLGMDTDALLLQFAEGLQARLAARRGPRLFRRGRAPDAAPLGSPRPRLITSDLMLAGVLIGFLIGFVAWGVIRISAMRASQSPTATAPAISDVLAQVGTPTNAYAFALTMTPLPAGGDSTGGEAAQTVEPQPSATLPLDFTSSAVQVIISVRLRSWMRVTVDGKVAFEGRVQAGSAFPFAGDDRIEILTGNGAGLDVNFNQTDIGTLGILGEAVQRVFTVQGMQTPTATITFTPAPVTPAPTLTPTP